MQSSSFETSFITKEKLPLVITPKDKNITLQQFFQLLRTKKDAFKEASLQYGGLLFRGFPLRDEHSFGAAIAQLDTGPFADYIGGDSPRDKIAEGIYTSTEAPPSVKIPLHNELSFVKKFPKYIYFFCQLASEQGGETILGDARSIYKAMNPTIIKKFQDKGLRYCSNYYHKSALMDTLNSWQRSHKSWTQVFETDAKDNVELKCREHDFAFCWQKNGWLNIKQTRPATLEHHLTKEKIWFNQVHLYDFNPKLLGWWRYCAAQLFYCRSYTKLHEVSYADGSQIARNDIYSIMETLDRHTVSFPWQKGDMLLLDNVLTMHGRAPFKGKRRILTAMTG